MRTARRLLTVTAVGFMFTIGACQETTPPTAPDATIAPDAPSELLGTVTSPSGPTVETLGRTVPLERDEVARARVGLLGATLHLPRSGLTVVIPPGAAPIGTRIKVEAPKGDLVGYHFSPHGLRFLLPVTLVQELKGTEAEHELIRPLIGAYFEGPLLSQMTALEIVPLQVEGGAGGQAVLTINHFSGYIVATN